MELLAVAGAVVGAVAVLNLLLTFGVIRRLREHTDLLTDSSGALRGAPTMIDVGKPIAAFTARAVDGNSVSRDELAGLTMVGVFAPDCDVCLEKLPVFVEHSARFPGGRQNVLALVIASDDIAATRYIDTLADTALVIREDRHGAVSAAFGITGYPAFALVGEDGVVQASALDPGRLPLPERRRA